MSIGCLYTTVKNPLAVPVTYSFLGANGVRLDPNETYDVPGDLLQSVRRKPRYSHRREINALVQALAVGDLQVVTPASGLIKNSATGVVSSLTYDGTVFGVTAPCWTA